MLRSPDTGGLALLRAVKMKLGEDGEIYQCGVTCRVRGSFQPGRFLECDPEALHVEGPDLPTGPRAVLLGLGRDPGQTGCKR